MKRKATSGDEQDVVYARHWYCYLKRPGVTSAVKRRMRRRERRQAHADIRKDVE